jgi:hypothetical protein
MSLSGISHLLKRAVAPLQWMHGDQHGATATTAMTHVAIVEQLDGKTVEWMEKVSDEEYARAMEFRGRSAKR